MAANEIITRIWIGNMNAAHDPSFLASKKITVIFNCTKDIEPEPLRAGTWKGRHYRVPIDDTRESQEINNLSNWSYEIIYNMLREYNHGETILVHCYAGRQRSAACVAMLLIALGKLTTDEAIEFIRIRRTAAFYPQANFEQSIRTFEHHMRTSVFSKLHVK